MQLYNDIILYLIGIIIYQKKPQWVLFYWFSLTPIFLPFSSILTRSFSYEQFTELTEHFRVLGRNYLFILVLFEWLKKTNRIPRITGIYISITILMVYLTTTNIINHFSIKILWGYLSELLSLILPLIFLIFKKEAIPTKNQIIYYLKILFVIEIIAVTLNLFNIYIYAHFYVSHFITTNIGKVIEIDDSNLVSGTFPRYNSLANFITTIYLFITLEYFSKTNIKPFIYHIISIILFIIIILTGAKISLVLFVFIYLIGCTYYYKQHVKSFITAWGMIIIASLLFSTFKGMNIDSNTGGVNRQIEGLTAFIETEKDDDNQSTIGLSFYLLNNYFYKAPFFGNNLSYKGEYAYGNRGICTLSLFYADSRLAYQLVEFGLIGMTLYLLFFISIFLHLMKSRKKQEKIKLKICFFYFILLTISESGLFDRTIFPLIYIYALCILSPTEKYKTYKLTKEQKTSK